MRNKTGLKGQGPRSSHPLLALLVAAVAAIGVIAQSGLMLDSAASEKRDDVAKTAPGPVATKAVRPRVAAAAQATPVAETSRPN